MDRYNFRTSNIILSVEFNASKRGLNEIKKLEIVDNKELGSSRSMLTAAALTYVASAATSLLEIIRLLMILNSRERRR